jgi:hypothetical protein
MARSKRKRGSSKKAYQSIRKPVPPPSKVEKDRRRKILDDIERRERSNSRSNSEDGGNRVS